MSKRQGPPKHQNRYAWKPNLGQKINETEPGGRFRPLSEITGVCQRCKDQIDWKRRYGKYKPIVEPAKCQKCGKRNVRQAYHNVCTACSKDLGICAKCCTQVKQLIGRDVSEEESERKALEEAIRGARERERRTLLRLMNRGNGGESGPSVPKIADRSREGDIFPVASLDEYAEQARQQDDSDEEEGGEFPEN
ncbi:uncharacterized protein C9orf85 homolog [Oryza brachyantha]|uniref:DUF2039 domain-containing protein n=1 Tax=Oryza brachyantha TaxID=4533 RepID=J3L4C2_ORYBR|nr:uncharacterized protein C9orf85 homolog [Oryza brachyantha]